MAYRRITGAPNVVKLERPPKENEEILHGLGRGDPAAAVALYERFEEMVNRLVWRLLGADPDHDDIVHQVFVNVISSIDTLASPASMGAWIAGVTVNTVRKELRSRRVRRIVFLSPRVPERIDEGIDTERQLLVRRFYEVVDRMKAMERIVFILRFVEGQPVGQVASTCGCSIATAKRRIAGAKKAFMRKARRDSLLGAIIEDMSDERRRQDP